MKPTLKLCSSHSVTGISKTPDLVTSLEPVPLLFRARGTTRESLIEGAKQKHTQREGLYDLRIRCRGVGQSQHAMLKGGVSQHALDKGGVWPGKVSAGGEGHSAQGMSAGVWQTSPVNRMTDGCKNITLPQLFCRR